ncbi:MAG: hypothetical protein ABIN80_04215 [Dyadobacter sp.]|uniref:hypothetical protein n=1 Tax=Dyadobacter sp. TaxID=1914288 RepID=UPI003264AA5B
MKTFHLVAFLLMLLLTWSCGESKTEAEKSGRLQYVKILKYGAAGTHGGQGWYVDDRILTVDDKEWKPSEIRAEDISGCHASPNQTVEALNCHSFVGGRSRALILRIRNGKPEVVLASDDNISNGNNLGEWVGDGHWLLFTNYFFNVETSERVRILGLPDDPENHFVAASPDLKTIIYRETGFDTRYDLPPPRESQDAEIKEQYDLFYDHIKKGIVAFWLIDAPSGKTRLLELNTKKYPALVRTSDHSWLNNFRKMMIWKKDKDGKDQLIYPD